MEHVYFVCGDCAATLAGINAIRSDKPEHAEISLGRSCDVAAHLGVQATSVFEVSPEVFDRLFPKEAGALGGEWEVNEAGIAMPKGAPPPVPIDGVGPLTVLSAGFAEALMRHAGPAAADPLTVEQCVRLARHLLSLTRGA